MSDLTVVFAVYGALKGGNQDECQAVNVKEILQTAINASQGIVKIDNSTMGGDPSVGNTKHFGAIVTHDSKTNYFACKEGQTIDFYHTLPPSSK